MKEDEGSAWPLTSARKLSNSSSLPLAVKPTVFFSGCRTWDQRGLTSTPLSFCPRSPHVRYYLLLLAAGRPSWHSTGVRGLEGTQWQSQTGFTSPGHRPLQGTALEMWFILNFKTFLGNGRMQGALGGGVWERLAKHSGKLKSWKLNNSTEL